MMTVAARSNQGDDPANESRTTATLANTVAATAYANHLSCWRSSPVDRRNRKNGEMLATRMTASPAIYTGGAKGPPLMAWMAGIAAGLGISGDLDESWMVESNIPMINWPTTHGTANHTTIRVHLGTKRPVGNSSR